MAIHPAAVRSGRPRVEPAGSTAAVGLRELRRRVLAQRTAGTLLALAGLAILMGSITAEALYPALYTTHADTLSHLGASEPPNSVVLQPSAAIFDTTMLVTGAMILVAAYLVYRARFGFILSAVMAVLGIGILGVGVFPLTHPAEHTVFALLAFYSAGAAAIVSARWTPSPLRQLCAGLGVVSLAAITLGLLLIDWGPIAALGEGGIERWNAYPAVIWLVAFGSFLMSRHASRPLNG